MGRTKQSSVDTKKVSLTRAHALAQREHFNLDNRVTVLRLLLSLIMRIMTDLKRILTKKNLGHKPCMKGDNI